MLVAPACDSNCQLLERTCTSGRLELPTAMVEWTVHFPAGQTLMCFNPPPPHSCYPGVLKKIDLGSPTSNRYWEMFWDVKVLVWYWPYDPLSGKLSVNLGLPADIPADMDRSPVVLTHWTDSHPSIRIRHLPADSWHGLQSLSIIIRQ